MNNPKLHIKGNPLHSEKQDHLGKRELKNGSQLWNEFRNGSDTAFVKIYEFFFPILYSYGHQFTKDTELIKDIVQEFFIEIRNSRNKLSETTSIKAYFYKSIRRKVLRALSKKNRMVYRSNLEKEFDFEISISQESILIKEQIKGEQKLKLEKAFQALSKRQKEAIVYHYYDGLNYEEIASIMNLSKIKYARTLIYRSIDKLKKEIVLMTTIIIVLISLAAIVMQ